MVALKTFKKKKSKSGIIIALVIVAVVAAVIFVPMILRGDPNSAYAWENVKRGDVTSYYSFSGVVESKNIQNLVADSAIKIHEINFKEGDSVKIDDVLMTSSYGKDYKATIDGQISKLYVAVDDNVLMGAKLMDIIDYKDLQVQVKIGEYELGSVKLGKKVSVKIGAIGKTVSGKVSEISKDGINVNGVAYFTATIGLSYNSKILPGMNAEVKILNKKAKNVLTVSMSALQFDSNNKAYVLLRQARGLPVQRYLTIGINDGQKVQVKSGLNFGEAVVSQNSAVSATSNSGFMPPVQPRTN